MSLEIKLLNIQDAKELSEVAFRAYFDHYRNYWYDDGEWYANKSFNINQLGEELTEEENLFYMAIFNKNPVGFLKIRPDNQLSKDTENGFEIERIYLTKAAQGHQIGKALMAFSENLAKKMNKNHIWLKTMDTSVAKTFYEYLGFEICGTVLLDFEMMKTEMRGMFVMKKSLK